MCWLSLFALQIVLFVARKHIILISLVKELYILLSLATIACMDFYHFQYSPAAFFFA